MCLHINETQVPDTRCREFDLVAGIGMPICAKEPHACA